ncbi:MAG: aspartate--ammonia ligase [Clostridia bacterium]|nr:aspartate--ammonia ligase [Clostridia bacterium]
MNTVIVPDGYKSSLDLYETQKAIALTKRIFQDNLIGMLGLQRVSAPLMVVESTGLNDGLNGTERPVSFDIPAVNGSASIVHSLAKWKRMALAKYGFTVGRGLYTDMNAIRRDEESLDNIHSVYVDQWDWEKIITKEQRNTEYLYSVVDTIVGCICDTQEALMNIYPVLKNRIKREVTYITSEQLLQKYPGRTAKEREYLISREYGTVFISQIGGALSDGTVHDGRAPDYDDWEFNGDIIFYNELLDIPFEVSSMGIRVDEKSLMSQLKIRGCEEWAQRPFHKALLNGELPLTIGGGIGQSRLCMLIMNKAHIGEVQSSIWDENTVRVCREHGIELL